MIIVIDGPAGAGKSTTAREVARQTGCYYVDSGAVYRGFTYLYVQCNNDSSRFLNRLEDHKLRFDFHDGKARVFWGDREITESIRSREITQRVSEVAIMPEIRNRVQDILRKVCQGRNVILEGRDLGTVVFPDADIKFFLTADQEARALRRYREQIRNGEDVTLEQVSKDVEKRDRIDSAREIAPLRKADDAVEVDTTLLTFKEQVAKIVHRIRDFSSVSNVKNEQV